MLFPVSWLCRCVSQCSIAVRNQHDRDNTYKGKHLTGACLQFQRFRSLSLQWQGQGHGQAGRCGAKEVAESCVWTHSSRKRETLGLAYLNAHPRWHSSSNQATFLGLSNSAQYLSLWRPLLSKPPHPHPYTSGGKLSATAPAWCLCLAALCPYRDGCRLQ